MRTSCPQPRASPVPRRPEGRAQLGGRAWYGTALSCLPFLLQCLEKFPVIQHFKFGSLLPIHPVTAR